MTGTIYQLTAQNAAGAKGIEVSGAKARPMTMAYDLVRDRTGIYRNGPLHWCPIGDWTDLSEAQISRLPSLSVSEFQTVVIK